jgi:uncharacterized protein (TIGR02996 family)
MGTTRDVTAMIAAAKADRKDRTAWLVLADALDEAGRHEEAKAIRKGRRRYILAEDSRPAMSAVRFRPAGIIAEWESFGDGDEGTPLYQAILRQLRSANYGSGVVTVEGQVIRWFR